MGCGGDVRYGVWGDVKYGVWGNVRKQKYGLLPECSQNSEKELRLTFEINLWAGTVNPDIGKALDRVVPGIPKVVPDLFRVFRKLFFYLFKVNAQCTLHMILAFQFISSFGISNASDVTSSHV